MFRLSVADLDSPSYFVATAAAELGFFKQEGIDVTLERIFGALEGPERLRDGTLDFFGGPAFAATRAFPAWKGAKLLCALSQYSYWFLAVRADLDIKRGDINALKGLRLSASPPWPAMTLEYMLIDAGIDLKRDNVRIVAAKPVERDSKWQGQAGINAIREGVADAYWGNGMRVALGEKLGIAKMHLDLRRGDGPPGARWYNFAALTTTERLCETQPEAAAAAVRAIVKTQAALKANPALATDVGHRLFPPDVASLIGDLIARDAPFYAADIKPEAVDGVNKLARAIGLIEEPVPYEQMVATQFRDSWRP